MSNTANAKVSVPKPPIPDGPYLHQLAGMGKARVWGEALAQDLQLYKAGRLNWSEIDRGCVLHGPPGTGKTTIAKAIAATAKVPFIATSFADWSRGQYVNDVIAPMRQVFETAAANAPCIVAIDELDSLPSRDTLPTSHVGTQMIINALLEQLDGFTRRPGVVVIGTCNHPNGLDAALVRPGRLDRMIYVPLPSLEALPQIIAFHLADDAKRFGDLSAIAILCVGMSGASIEQLVRDARNHARRQTHKFTRADLLAVLESRAKTLDSATQWRIAVHEAGHAVVALRLKVAAQINLSIVAHEGLGGKLSIALPNIPLTRKLVEERIVMMLAGRAAEDVFLGAVSAGAGGEVGSDLAQATELGLAAVAKLGLSVNGTLLWQPQEARAALSAYPSDVIDEVDDLLRDAYERAKKLIEDDWDFTNNVALALVKRRALSHKEFVAIDRRPITPSRFSYFDAILRRTPPTPSPPRCETYGYWPPRSHRPSEK